MEEIKNYIGGEWLAPQSHKYLPNLNPATGEAYSLVPDSDERDVKLAIQSAQEAFPAWAALSPRKRAGILRDISRAILAKKEDLARAESVDTGKPFHVAMKVDIPRAAQNFEFFADSISQWASESHPMAADAVNFTLRDPIGVVACISPWNLPLYLLSWKIAPALAAGNCVIAKPSEVTPMTAHLLTKICQEAGLPKGVLNLVHGLGGKIGPVLSTSPAIAAISFTGSTQTGAAIASLAAPLFKKLSLEMGGKNPNLVFADCNFAEAVEETVRAAFSNQGQICLCGSRIYVEEKMYEKFKVALVERVKALKVGDPLEAGSDQGAVVSQAQYDKVLSYIELAKKEGGRILAGGNTVKVEGRCEKGLFIAPTLIEGLGPDCRTNQEEIFGPVATLTPFTKEDEAIAWANSTRYGLAATVWTQDISRAHRVAKALKAGIVWINCWMLRDLRTPFGGTKDSGVGREGGTEVLRFFTEPKNICVKF